MSDRSLDVHDAGKLAQVLEELGDAVVGAAHLDAHRDPDVELHGILGVDGQRDDLEARQLGLLLQVGQEGGDLGLLGQRLEQLALLLLQLGELVAVGLVLALALLVVVLLALELRACRVAGALDLVLEVEVKEAAIEHPG